MGKVALESPTLTICTDWQGLAAAGFPTILNEIDPLTTNQILEGAACKSIRSFINSS